MAAALDTMDVADTDRWRRLLHNAETASCVRDVALFSAPPRATHLSHFVNSSLPSDVHREYVEEFARQDTQINRLLRGSESEITGTDLLSEVEATTCPVHKRYLAPHDIECQVVSFFKTSDGARHTAAFIRKRQDPTFTPGDRRLIAALTDNLKVTLEIAQASARSTQVAESTLHQLSCATLTLDQSGTIHHNNAEATQLLSRYGIDLSTRCWRTTERSLEEPLWALQRAVKQRQTLRLVVESRQELIAVKADPMSQSPLTLVTVRSTSGATGALADRFGLTPAESSVARLLACGLNPKQCAERLGIKLSTARTHVRSIFNRMDVGTQHGFTRKLVSELL